MHRKLKTNFLNLHFHEIKNEQRKYPFLTEKDQKNTNVLLEHLLRH